MRHVSLLIAGATLALAACSSHDAPGTAARGAVVATPQQASIAHAARTIATLPDRGQLVAYTHAEPIRRTAYTWHPASISEEHALRAIASGTLEFEAPDGTPIRLRYARHVEHEDGNWTWIGRPDGAQPGTEAIITFGDKAVFGSLPNPKGGLPLRITTAGNGRIWIMETDPAALKRLVAQGRAGKPDDVRSFPALAGARDQVVRQAALAPQKLTPSGAVPESATVDVAIGYTNGFASRLGGTSQALTRLRYLIDVANLAFSNSQIVGQVRLAGTIALNYPDNTDNGTALDQLTGMTCGTSCQDIPIPAALQPLHTLREQVKADLISMVRNFNDPENQSCGNAWLLGGGGEVITRGMAYAAVSVVSDSNFEAYPDNGFICRDETFVHELGHNMGSNHDADTSAGDDGVVDKEDEGAFPYSFGYKTAVGNFYTIMAYRDVGQKAFLVFSNPSITSCDGYPCGTGSANNAKSLGQTMPVVATFYAKVLSARDDLDGNLISDLVWRNTSTGANAAWRGASSSSSLVLSGVPDQAWKVVGMGDFNGDNKSDLLWRNTRTGANAIWRSGNSATPQTVSTVASQDWQVAGVGDFDGEGHDDILWRHRVTGQNVIFRGGLGTGAGPLTITGAPTAWKVAGIGDFNADGKADILWRNLSDGRNVIWHSASSGNAASLVTAPLQAWTVAGVGDFDSDGRDDILWRNTTSGSNQVWPGGVNASARALRGVSDQNFRVARVADYNGDGNADILWRNGVTGATIIWRSGDGATSTTVGTVAAAWVVAGNG